MNNLLQVAAHWDKVAIRKAAGKYPHAWWNNRQVLRHVSKLLTGTEYNSLELAIQAWLRQNTTIPFKHGISLGAGTGSNEASLLDANIVEHFTLLELSQVRADMIRAMMAKKGLTNRVKIIVGDGMTAKLPANYYDFVYWNNSLHHMFNVRDAIRWSHTQLADHGTLAMFEYVGPNRFQFDTKVISLLNRLRYSMPSYWFPSTLHRETCCPPIEYWMKRDPSEAADSEAILPELRSLFRDILSWPLGGLIYHVAMQDIWDNVNVTSDAECLKRYLDMDVTLTKEIRTVYTAVIARKENVKSIVIGSRSCKI